jgi:hypothetical protein
MYCFIQNGIQSRREGLERHLKTRGIGEHFKIIWNTDWDKDHPFVLWLKNVVAPHVSVELLSNHVKAFESMKKAVEDNQDFFMCVDDDVVFPENFLELLQKVPLKPMNIVSMGINYHIPYSGVTTVTGNVGGLECFIMSKEFAKFILDNIDFEQALDIVIGAVMARSGMQLAVTPICHQTSLLTPRYSSHQSGNYKKDWKEYTHTYKPSGLTYSSLKKKFDAFMIKKHAVEKMYKDKFDTDLDIWNVDYIEKQYLILSSTIASPIRPNAKIIGSKST